jgi:hypothetical protein
MYRHASLAFAVIMLLAGAAHAQKKLSGHAFAAKRTYAIKKAIAAKFHKVTGLPTTTKQIRFSSQRPLYVSSGPKGARGSKLETRAADFKVLGSKHTYLGNTVSHTSRTNPARTKLSYFGLKQRKRAARPKPRVTRSVSFLRALANDAGEYFQPGEQYRPHVRGLNMARVPARLQQIFAARLGKETRSVRSSGQNQNSAMYGESHRIVNDRGRTIGYVLGIDHYIGNNSLWDGSGVRVFYNTKGQEIATVPWTG